MEPKKNTLKEIKSSIIDCLQSLTTHGIPNLFRSKSIFLKIIWFFLVIISFSASIYFIIQTLLEYTQFNVNTEVRLIDTDEIDFPSLVICNKNQFSSNKSFNYLKSRLNEFGIQYENIFNNGNNTDYFMQNYVRFILKYTELFRLFDILSINERHDMTKTIQDTFISCSIGSSSKCNESDFEWIFNKVYGNCYRFNSNINNSKKITSPNARYGLEVNLYVGMINELNVLGLEKGFYLAVQDKNGNPYQDFDNVVDVGSGVETHILIQRSIYNKYPKPYSNCDFNQDKNAFPLSFDLKYYNQVLNANYIYSQELCIDFCYQDYIKSKCNCSIPTSSIRLEIVNCSNSNESVCAYEINKIMNKNERMSKCVDKCPLECKRNKYDVIVSKSDYPSVLAQKFKYELKLINKLEINNNGDDIKKDLVRFFVYYGSMSYVQFNESPSISIFGLISNLGGTLGLFLGILFDRKNLNL